MSQGADAEAAPSGRLPALCSFGKTGTARADWVRFAESIANSRLTHSRLTPDCVGFVWQNRAFGPSSRVPVRSPQNWGRVARSAVYETVGAIGFVSQNCL